MKRIFITCLNGFLLACPLQAQTQIADIFPGLSSSAPAAFKEYSGRLYFVADDGTSGRELWSTDLSGQNRLLHKDIRAGSLGSDPAGLRDGPQRLDSLRSEEHTSELQSRRNLVCRLLLDKKKKNKTITY